MQHQSLSAALKTDNKMKVKIFKDIRDLIFGLSDEEWNTATRDISYSYTKLEMIIMCSSMVKLLSTHVIECVLPTIIDGIGIEPVLQAERKLKEKATQGAQTYHATPQESLEDPCDCLCSFIEGVVTQIKEAIKQALLQFISVETPAQSLKLLIADSGQQTSSAYSVTNGLTSLYTKAIILELIQLSCPGISHLVPKGKKPEQPVSFYRVIRSIMKAMRHTEDVHGCPSTSDDKESAISGGCEKTIYDEKFKKKAVLAISSILCEAKDQVISAGFSLSNNDHCIGPLGEITITESPVRLWPTATQITEKFLKGLKAQSDQTNPDSIKLHGIPSRNIFFPAACETYKFVQKEVMSFLFKVQKSAESNYRESENSDASSSGHSSEHRNPSVRNVLKGSSSTSLCEKELLHIDKCTDEVICKILSAYRTQNQTLSSDRWRSACSQVVCELLIRKVQMLHPGKIKRTSHRRLSCNLIKHLESAALDITQSFSRDLEESLEAASGDETQNGYSSLNHKSALDYTNVFAPFHLFRNVRYQIREVFSTVNEADLSVGTTEKSTDREGFSHGFAQRQFHRPSSAINQLKAMLSFDTTMLLTNSISTLLSSMIGAISILRRFSHLIQKKAAPISSARDISMLVDNVALEFIKHLAGYFVSTVSTFSHLPVQTETLSCFKGKLKTDSGQEIIVALWDLTNSLSYFLTEFMKSLATSTNQTQNQESQSSAVEDECPGLRLRPPVGKKKKRRRPAIHSSKRSTNPSCPAGHQKIYSFNGVNGNKDSSVETVGCYLCGNFSAFFRVLRKRFKRR